MSSGSTASRAARRPACPSPRSGRARPPIAAASASRVGCSAMSIPARSRIASRSVTRRQGGARSISSSPRSTLVVPSTRSATSATRFSRSCAVLLVVGVGLVPLEHRELGVVLVRDALVAEVLAELVDAVDAADDQPLQVQLGGDAQVEVAVERVVVGREGPRQRAAVERLQDRRLHLDEAVLVEPAADLGDRTRPRAKTRGSPRWRSGPARAGGTGSRCPRGRGTCRAAAAGSWRAAASGRSPARARRGDWSPAPCPRCR